MYNDLLTKALDQAKGLQKIIGDTMGKGAEAAQPLIHQTVSTASDLTTTLLRSAADATEAAKPHLEGALTQLGSIIEISKNALETGVSKAHEQLEPLAEQVRKTIETANAATAKKPADGFPPPDAGPH